MKQNFTQYGFTLIELMITIVILSIALSLAVSSFRSVIQNNAIRTMTSDLISALNLARSESIKRNIAVSVCASSDQTFTACGSSWSVGWFAFLNPDQNGVFANNSTETLLRTRPVTTQNVTITTSNNNSIITYTPQGFANTASANTVFTIMATGCTGDSGRTVTVSLSGNITVNNATCP